MQQQHNSKRMPNAKQAAAAAAEGAAADAETLKGCNHAAKVHNLQLPAHALRTLCKPLCQAATVLGSNIGGSAI
jgi:hypothetical protein